MPTAFPGEASSSNWRSSLKVNMKASLRDRSNYFRGLLVLIGRDRIIHPGENTLTMGVGKILDFDRRFCEAAVKDLLGNEHINENPITFEERVIAECFLRDALRMALIDNDIHSRELAWLKTVAGANDLPGQWMEGEYRKLGKIGLSEITPESLEINKYL
jgi:hypothetical protein